MKDRPTIGAISLKAGLVVVADEESYSDSKYQSSLLDVTSAPRCSDPKSGIRCAPKVKVNTYGASYAIHIHTDAV